MFAFRNNWFDLVVIITFKFLTLYRFYLSSFQTSLWEYKTLRLYPIRWDVNLVLTSSSEPAGVPQNVQGQNSSSTSILAIWDEVPADLQNGIITGYTITYHSQTENDNNSVQVNGSVSLKQLTNLKEYVIYNITVFASTVKGDGPASDPIVVTTAQDSK